MGGIHSPIVDEYIKFWTVYLTEALSINISPSPMFCVCPKFSSKSTRKCDKMCVKTPRQQRSDVLFAVHSRRMHRSLHWRVGTPALQVRNTYEPTWVLGREDRCLKPDASAEWSFHTIEHQFTLGIYDPIDTWWDMMVSMRLD